jgi:hypothetical protein
MWKGIMMRRQFGGEAEECGGEEGAAVEVGSPSGRRRYEE